MLVTTCPSSGVPEVSSKIEPTEAIAAKQENSSNTPLLGVMYIIFTDLELNNCHNQFNPIFTIIVLFHTINIILFLGVAELRYNLFHKEI